jgi:histidine triad (HIT) family protein
MTQCLFCSILAGDTAGTFLHRDKLVAVFLDIHPVNLGHLLVVPLVHSTGLTDLPAATGSHMFAIAQRMAQAVKESGLPCEGVNFFLADGKVAMQEIMHVHLHVIPRVQGDGFGLRFAKNPACPSRAELESAAAQIGSHFVYGRP